MQQLSTIFYGGQANASTDTASPISSHGQSTTIATGTVGARCLMLFEHAAHRSRMYADAVPGALAAT